MENFHRMASQYHSASRMPASIAAAPSRAYEGDGETSFAPPNIALRTFVRRLPARHTAEQIFERVFADKSYAFWLDSSLTREQDGRFSFLGGYTTEEVECLRYYAHNRRLIIRRGELEELSEEDLFPFLKKRLATPQTAAGELPFDFTGGFVGYFGYELKAVCGSRLAHRAPHPDCMALYVTRFVAVDHLTGEIYLVFTGDCDAEPEAISWFDRIEAAMPCTPTIQRSTDQAGPETIQFTPIHSEDQYLKNINRSLEAIRNGETYEVCLTNQMVATTSVDAFEYYKKLRQLNPAPYSAFLQYPEISIACSSPERFLKINRDAVVETKPIKGTCRRGVDSAEDESLRRSLSEDEKSRAENLMIVDLLRNDLGRVCSVGSVHVPKLMHVETYATVHQLVTTVRGTLAPQQTAVDCLHSAFPGGSMTGAPKIRTMELIDELEGAPRSIYSGSIGFLSFNGCADLNIVIRTAVFARNTVRIGVGGAVIALSDPHEEWTEILLKARALLATFEALNKTVILTSRSTETHGKAINLSKRVG
jgi:para-aminobenzoate synthetase